MFEVEQRMEFTKKIKSIYRDDGHFCYNNILLDQIKAIVNQIKELKCARELE